jgi:uncharacterized membrane protein YhhN
MSSAVGILLVAAAVVAAVDWTAVATSRRSIELISKPLVAALLLVAALALTPEDDPQRALFAAALALSLGGDIALLMSARWFSLGLASFGAAHVAYVLGLLREGVSTVGAVAGLVLAAAGAFFLGRPIVAGAGSRRAGLGVAVGLYVAVISATVIAAGASGDLAARVGATLLYVSDSILGWNRFVAPMRYGRLATRVTYHVGQASLVLSLVT